jgi:hypothetical protein
MKIPSLIVLAVFAALPVRADVVSPARCDVKFLENVVAKFTGVNSVPDLRIEKNTRIIGGESRTRDVLRFGDATTCDAGTWRHLAAGLPAVWRNAAAKNAWDEGNAKSNAVLLLVVDDFYKSVDPRITELLAAAEEVLAAGIALGVAAPVQPVKKHVDFLKANSGGSFAAATAAPTEAAGLKIIVPAEQKGATITPDSAGPTWRKVLDETGAGGTAVLRFRMAVLALADDIGRLGNSSENVSKRNSAEIPGVTDFPAGLPSSFSAPKVDRAEAMDDAKFGVVLKMLIGAERISALNDASPREGALLEPVDLGVRNLVAIRATQVELVVAAAKQKLGTETIIQIEASARATVAARANPGNLFTANVLKRLAETSEYRKLNAMYDRSRNDTSEAGKEQTQKIFEERTKLEAAALSATVETDAATGRRNVVYTQNDVKTTFKYIVPDSLDTDAAARNNASAVIAGSIVAGAKSDAKYLALVAVVGGEGRPGGSLTDTGLKSREREAANDVPPAVKNVREGSQGCEKPGEIIKNDHEIYAQRQQAKAAEVTTDNLRERTKIIEKQNTDLAANTIRCKTEEAAAMALKAQDDFESPTALKTRQDAAKAVAGTGCEERRLAIEKIAMDAGTQRKAAEAKNNSNIVIDAANREVIASFKISVHASADKLRAQYADPKSLRHRQLIADAKLSGSSARLIAFSNYWFDTNWPPLTSATGPAAQTLQNSIDTCANKLGLGATIKDAKISYKNPENPDKVDAECGVRKDVKDYVVKQKGQVD